MPRTWKAALAPFLAGIPERTGLVGEWRFGLVNDLRFGERKLPRMVDQCAALALPADAPPPENWPLPELRVPPAEVTGWRERQGWPTRPAGRGACAGRGRAVEALARRLLSRSSRGA